MFCWCHWYEIVSPKIISLESEPHALDCGNISLCYNISQFSGAFFIENVSDVQNMYQLQGVNGFLHQ